MKSEQIIPAAVMKARAPRDQNPGNGGLTASTYVSNTVALLNDELVDNILAGRGLRGWLRAVRVAKVLGLFALYLFLDTYDIRADFNRRMETRRRDMISLHGWLVGLKARTRAFALASLDKTIRLLRLLMFRGREGSVNKTARLEQQAVWLRKSLIGLGPTFIKIGQTLGTRADLLPLAYVKELATLQDSVPAFPTAEAFARIETELGKSLAEC
ncbi:MAG TPA: hypothetical protein VF961_02245, partial [Pyrinomonadaceae bacterium]